MKPPKPTDTHVLVKATKTHPTKSKGFLLWSAPIRKGTPLINYLPAAVFNDADAGHVKIKWGSDPHPLRARKCHEDVPGTIPSWAGEDQIDPCPCVLDFDHDGIHKCAHDLAKEERVGWSKPDNDGDDEIDA